MLIFLVLLAGFLNAMELKPSTNNESHITLQANTTTPPIKQTIVPLNFAPRAKEQGKLRNVDDPIEYPPEMTAQCDPLRHNYVIVVCCSRPYRSYPGLISHYQEKHMPEYFWCGRCNGFYSSLSNHSRFKKTVVCNKHAVIQSNKAAIQYILN